MTKNYKIAEIETTPVPMRMKMRPKEEYEKDKEGKGIMEQMRIPMFVEDPTPIKTTIDWVSHGNYALIQPNRNKKEGDFFPWIYIDMEPEYFDEIIKAFEEKSQPTDPFEPFFCKTLPPRGMHFMEEQLRVFFYRNKEGLIIQEFMADPWSGYPHSEGKELGFTLDDFKKIRDLALAGRNKPYHCCTINYGKLEKVEIDPASFQEPESHRNS